MFGVQVIHHPVLVVKGQEQKLWPRKCIVTRDSYPPEEGVDLAITEASKTRTGGS